MVRFIKRLSVLLGLMLPALTAPAQDGQVEVIPAVKHDVSMPLRDIPPLPPKAGPPREIPLLRPRPSGLIATQADPVIQSAATTALAATAGLNFDGLGQGALGFRVDGAPADANGAVGATQFVQWVNESFAVFNKTTGARVHGPAAGNTLWNGFGGPCEANNDGDPIAQYDKLANRWVLSQFAVTGGPPFFQCVAVSTTPDATGPYARYAFEMPEFNDYTKIGVWPDAYYASSNMFHGNAFVGARACAFDRASMLKGLPATAQCFQQSSTVANLLPADLDGTTVPPLGSSNFFLNFDFNSLNLWKFHVDWATPANSMFTGPTNIPVAAFSEACNGGACIPQDGTPQRLDSLGDRLMYRLAYRNFGGHESLVVNHSVAAGNSVGVRWYELRSPGRSPVVFQQGTYAPDGNFRWMGSIAMDHVGNIAMGYSVSSGGMNPAIRFSGRVPGDPPGAMAAETSIIAGTGSQTRGLNRWGDYSSISVDPADDCTFWYTTEYLKSFGMFNWSTRIASFKFPSCGGAASLTSLTLNPASVAGGAPSQGTVTLSTAASADTAVLLSSNNPSVAQVPASVTVPAGATSATFTVTTSAVTLTSTVTISAALGGVSQNATLTVTPATR